MQANPSYNGGFWVWFMFKSRRNTPIATDCNYRVDEKECQNLKHELKFRVFWDVLPCCQVDVNMYLTTRQYISEDS
jgi:hypothetical protein